jgi:hypothetical protein
MDHETLISRIEIAAELGVQSQTIAHWERAGWFPRPKMTRHGHVVTFREFFAAYREDIAAQAKREEGA